MSEGVVIYGFFIEPKRDLPWDYPNVEYNQWWDEKTEGLAHNIVTRRILFMESHMVYSMPFVGIQDSLRELGDKLDPEPLTFPEDYTSWDQALLEFAKRAGFKKARIHESTEEDTAEPYTIRWWACASPL